MLLQRFSFLLPILSATAAYGQALMEGQNSGRPALLPADLAILDGHEIRSDLNCAVKGIDPHLGFDLRFHSGYDVTVPLQELTGNGNSLTAIFRVIAEESPDKPVYFFQKWSVPPIAEDSRGRAGLNGVFAMGEGRYQVEWLLHDREGRSCSARWQSVVSLRGKDRQISLRLARGAVVPEATDPFVSEAPVKRVDPRPFNVLLLLHVAPHAAGAVSMRAAETQALLGILQRIAEEPRIGRYSIVAFNLDQNIVLHRREDTPQLDLPELGDSFKQLRLGTVDAQKIHEKDSEAQFLGNLVTEELARSRPDAVIFVGSRIALDSTAFNRSMRELGEPRCSVFYLNYTPDLILSPWRDLIGTVVKLWKGSEYTISKPADLFSTWAEVMSRLSDARRPSITISDPSMQAAGLVPKK